MKVALITGGTGKLGSEIALHLAKKNFEVAITYHQSLDRLEKLKEKFLVERLKLTFYKCDFSTAENINELFLSFNKNFSKLDVLINCAGIFDKNFFTETTPKDFDFFININLKSIYFLIQKFSELMSENSVIINFSSVGGMIPWKDRSLYHISKAGVIALTRSLAIELAPRIRVVSIAPGFIEMEEEISEKMPISKIPLKRYGGIKNIISTVDFLIQNDYITGVTVPVDGGRSLI
ncbi:MAG: SDR family oxidoreductase [Ignavibacteria bacterium]